MIGNFNKVKDWLSENLLLILTFSGVVIGLVGGLALRYYEPTDSAIHLIAYPGELFMRLLKLMILPLVIASLVTGSASLNAKMSGMIAFRTILYFLITSLLSATVGLVLVVSIEPGKLEGLKQTLGNGECQAGRVCLSPFVCNLSTC